MYDKILELLQMQAYAEASVLTEKSTAEELATLLQTIPFEELTPFAQELDSNLLADALVLLPAEYQEEIFKGLRDDELEKVLDEISVDDTVDIIEEMPQEVVRRIAETDKYSVFHTEDSSCSLVKAMPGWERNRYSSSYSL